MTHTPLELQEQGAPTRRVAAERFAASLYQQGHDAQPAVSLGPRAVPPRPTVETVTDEDDNDYPPTEMYDTDVFPDDEDDDYIPVNDPPRGPSPPPLLVPPYEEPPAPVPAPPQLNEQVIQDNVDVPGQEQDQRFYLITHGRQTGIFRGWHRCAPLVLCFLNAVFQRYRTLNLAEEAWQNHLRGLEEDWLRALEAERTRAAEDNRIARLMQGLNVANASGNTGPAPAAGAAPAPAPPGYLSPLHANGQPDGYRYRAASSVSAFDHRGNPLAPSSTAGSSTTSTAPSSAPHPAISHYHGGHSGVAIAVAVSRMPGISQAHNVPVGHTRPRVDEDPAWWYVIARGRSRGIYRSWAEAAPHVSAYYGAHCRHFQTLAEAQAYLDNH